MLLASPARALGVAAPEVPEGGTVGVGVRVEAGETVRPGAGVPERVAFAVGVAVAVGRVPPPGETL